MYGLETGSLKDYDYDQWLASAEDDGLGGVGLLSEIVKDDREPAGGVEMEVIEDLEVPTACTYEIPCTLEKWTTGG
jgi:hypothetical protein